MGYYMRFIETDSTETTRAILDGALRTVDSNYSLTASGELKYGDDCYGSVEINRPGAGLFDEEIEELKRFVEDAQLGWLSFMRIGRKAHVVKTLDSATAIVSVQIMFGDRETEATLDKLDPLFQWLFANRKGLLQVDGEGYYDQAGRILKVE